MNSYKITLVATLGVTLLSADVDAQEFFAYPPAGHTEAQQQQDRFECHQWAVEQSGFDPAAPPEAAVRDAAQTPAVDASGRPVVGGAVKGAVIAEAAGGDASEGAAAGAALGVLQGRRDKREAAEQRARAEQQARTDARQAEAAYAQELAAKRAAYDRARGVCFQARGYTVSAD